MRVSVAMTTYNGEKFVEKQMLSILHQTQSPDEVIIFDDCSTDKTHSIIQQFIINNSLNNWILLTNKKNTGYIQNFYNAIQACSGDVIFLCDQDDSWEIEKVQTMVEVLADHPEISVLNTAVKLIDENDNTLNIKCKKGWSNANLLFRKVSENGFESFDLEYLALRNISPGCSMCFTKSIQEIYLKNKQQIIPHDWFINILGSLQNGTFFYNKTLTNYRIHTQNVIGVKTDKPLAVQTNRNIKIKTAAKYYERILYLKRFLEKTNSTRHIRLVTNYLNFLEMRLSFTKNLSFSKFCGMFRYLKIYRFAFGTRMIISDLIYLMRLDKYLQ